jgi:hypothetical protein
MSQVAASTAVAPLPARPRKIWMDGRLVDPAEATVSVYDHGLLYGDGVFEGLRCYRGRIFKMESHLRRLEESAARIRLPMPYSRQQLAAAMREWLCDPSEPVELHLDRVEWRPVFPCKSGRGAENDVPLERCPNPCVPLTEYLMALESAGRIADPRKPGRLRELTSAFVRAAQAASVGTSGLAGELLSGWARKFEERLREELVAKVIGHDGASELRRLAGSCYGSPESIALEAARRGVRRVLSVPMVG